MVWRRSPAFFVLWLLILLFYAVRAVLLRSGSLGYPALEPVEFLNFFLTILMVPPVVAALSCLSTPLNGEPVPAFLLGFATFLLSHARSFPPLGCLLATCPDGRGFRPGAALLLAFSITWGLGAALTSRSRDPQGVGGRRGDLHPVRDLDPHPGRHEMRRPAPPFSLPTISGD